MGLGPDRDRTAAARTEHGWLVVYHGVRQTVAGGLYRAGLALLDLERPATVLRRGRVDTRPGAGYEVSGDVPNVVFPCGLVRRPEDDRLFLYYGAADTRIALATASCSEVLEYLMACRRAERHRGAGSWRGPLRGYAAIRRASAAKPVRSAAGGAT